MKVSAKVIKCDRCRKRCRNMDGWNTDFVAGFVVGYVCPDCQTPQEDLEAELKMILGESEFGAELTVRCRDDLTPEVIRYLVERLTAIYTTPEVMRSKADRLARSKGPRGDRFWMVGLMRKVADAMESGDLWEDA